MGARGLFVVAFHVCFLSYNFLSNAKESIIPVNVPLIFATGVDGTTSVSESFSFKSQNFNIILLKPVSMHLLVLAHVSLLPSAG